MRKVLFTLPALLLAMSGSAQATTVQMEPEPYDGGTRHHVKITAAPGEINRISVDRTAARQITVKDGGAPITTGPGCTSDGSQAVCASPALGDYKVPAVSADLGDG